MAGEHDTAQRMYHALLKEADTPLIRYNLGLSCYDTRDYLGAVEQFRSADRMQNDDLDILFNLALSYKKAGELASAIDCYDRVLQQAPELIDAHYNLAGCYRELKEHNRALSCYTTVLDLDPDHRPSLNNIAYVYHSLGDVKNALVNYKHLVELDPDNEAARHMVNALEGKVESSPPASYIRQVFDSYSANYEESLLGQLEYSVPTQLMELLNTAVPERIRFSAGLDLGCGTGLGGEAFRDIVERLDGVDLSSQMLALAGEKAIYTTLIEGEIADVLQTVSTQYDFVLAADVFTYISDLSPVFTELKRITSDEAIFCFSTEHAETGTSTLRSTGRVAHAPGYITTLATDSGWVIRGHSTARLRKERGAWISGDLWVLTSR